MSVYLMKALVLPRAVLATQARARCTASAMEYSAFSMLQIECDESHKSSDSIIKRLEKPPNVLVWAENSLLASEAVAHDVVDECK